MFLLTGVSAVLAAGDPVKVDPKLQERINADASTGYIIHFKDRPNLSSAYTMEWKSRGRFVFQKLKDTADASQAGVKAYLTGRKVSYKSFWLANVILVEKSDLTTFKGLKNFSEIDRIEQIPKIILYEPVKTAPAGSQLMDVGTDIAHVNADQVWALGVQGSGIVVSSIDTGVRYTHQALVNQYRGNSGNGSFDHNYNWWDPYETFTAPFDDYGHGTHTMGTMVGSDGGANQIGMAPGAKWISCRGCKSGDCTAGGLLECAEWIAAPWDLNKANPNPDMRPHVVSNSWGDCSQSYDPWFKDVVDAWQAAGIYPVFANGNAPNCDYQEPPGCNTVGNPGRYGNVTGVGATGNSDGVFTTWSNWGPTDDPDTINPDGYPYLKPQVVAPGTDIRSSYNGSDTDYELDSGTSMSTPHVAGLVALVYSACPQLTRQYGAVETIIQQTAVPISYASNCGGEGPANIPNNATGYGEIDAYAAVDMAFNMCPQFGTVAGTVVDQRTQTPIPNATVTVNDYVTTTDAAGAYTMSLSVGSYTVNASAPGYADQNIQATIASDLTTTADFSLTAKSFVQVEGQVTDDSGANWPLYATIAATSSDGTVTAVTDARTGFYTMALYANTQYVFQISSYGYAGAEVDLFINGHHNRRNFTLTVAPGCFAPGYALSSGSCVAQKGGLITGLVLDANTGSTLSGMVVNASSGGTTSSDSYGRYVLFSPLKIDSLVANPSDLFNYGAYSSKAFVNTGGIATFNLWLPAAMFAGPPWGVSATLVQNSTAQSSFNLRNVGGLSTPFTISDFPVSSPSASAKVSLRSSKYTAPARDKPKSMGIAPQTAANSSVPSVAAVSEVIGEPAFGISYASYPYEFVTFNSSTPGIWTGIAPIYQQYQAGTFLNNDYSKLYALNYDDFNLYTIDTATGATTLIGPAATVGGNHDWHGLTASPNGTLYATTSDLPYGTSVLYTVDPTTANTTVIGTITNALFIISIAMDAQGNLYGLDLNSDVLVKIDPVTAEGTVIGSVGFDAEYAQGLAFDKTNGVLYLAAYNEYYGLGELRIVDTSTGNTTLVGQFPNGAEVDCFAFAAPYNLPWLEDPVNTGTLASRQSQSINVTFDAAGMSPGVYYGEIRVVGNTPYDSLLIPVTMEVTETPVRPCLWPWCK
jgi:subtilisin family serine protease